MTANSIELVSETYDEDTMEPPLRLDQLASEATFKKLKYALNDLGEYKCGLLLLILG